MKIERERERELPSDLLCIVSNHDFDPWGGMSCSTLRIVYALPFKSPLSASFTFWKLTRDISAFNSCITLQKVKIHFESHPSLLETSAKLLSSPMWSQTTETCLLLLPNPINVALNALQLSGNDGCVQKDLADFSTRMGVCAWSVLLCCVGCLYIQMGVLLWFVPEFSLGALSKINHECIFLPRS